MPGSTIKNENGKGSERDAVYIREALKMRKNRRRRSRGFFITFLILMLLSVGVLIIGTQYYLSPPSPEGSGQDILVSLPPGTSAANIANILENDGVVRNALVFRLYLMYTGSESSLMAGDYSLNSAMQFDEIINKLKAGDVQLDTRWFVIPEGYNIEQIGAYLQDEGIVEARDFLSAARNPAQSLFEKYPFLKDVPGSVDYHLEGYLFPARYEVKATASIEEVLNIMLSAFQKRMLTDERLAKIDQMDMTLHEILTMASIVEREAASGKERNIISSVFHNRINIGMMLQSCATIQYVLGEVKETLLNEDLRQDSPYNTYMYLGLPPGPVASPGEDSFYAALHPADTDYLYFVVKGDGSGEHFFGRTHQEHTQNRAKSQQNSSN